MNGYCVSLRSLAFGVTHHGVAITAVWGRWDTVAARHLTRMWKAALDGSVRDALLDASHLDSVDGAAFEILCDALEQHRLPRQAIVAQRDLGATVRGLLATQGRRQPTRGFATRADALAWLAHGCCTDEVTEIADARLAELARLRAWFEEVSLERATVEGAAARLAVGPRTLQRRLSAAGTRFGTELAHAKIARARRLMRDPARRLSDVALEVGCATPSAFSDLYRRMTGESPSQWRRRVG